jgi:hypothetical protein
VLALLPLLGGVLLGWLAPRKAAIIAQIACYAVAETVLTLTAPSHGGHYSDGIIIGIALAAVSTGTLYLGFWIGRRRRGPGPA